MKETAVFCRAWFEAAADLPPADFKELFLALADYAFNGANPENFNLLGDDLAPVARTILLLARPVMKKNAEKWEARLAEAGRPPIELTPEDAQQAVKVAGSVKGAAELLGVSESTIYRRKRAEKAEKKDCQNCQNVKNVNVNVNVNENENDRQRILTGESYSQAAAGQGKLLKGLPLPTPPPSGETITKVSAMFSNLRLQLTETELIPNEERETTTVFDEKGA